jgi:hypothetical protein
MCSLDTGLSHYLTCNSENIQSVNKTNSVAFRPRANYTDWATAFSQLTCTINCSIFWDVTPLIQDHPRSLWALKHSTSSREDVEKRINFPFTCNMMRTNKMKLSVLDENKSLSTDTNSCTPYHTWLKEQSVSLLHTVIFKSTSWMHNQTQFQEPYNKGQRQRTSHSI